MVSTRAAGSDSIEGVVRVRGRSVGSGMAPKRGVRGVRLTRTERRPKPTKHLPTVPETILKPSTFPLLGTCHWKGIAVWENEKVDDSSHDLQ